MTDELDTALERLVSDISALRSRVEKLNPPDSEAKQSLVEHLTLASSAALRLSFKSGEDDIIAVDG